MAPATGGFPAIRANLIIPEPIGTPDGPSLGKLPFNTTSPLVLHMQHDGRQVPLGREPERLRCRGGKQSTLEAESERDAPFHCPQRPPPPPRARERGVAPRLGRKLPCTQPTFWKHLLEGCKINDEQHPPDAEVWLSCPGGRHAGPRVGGRGTLPRSHGVPVMSGFPALGGTRRSAGQRPGRPSPLDLMA